MSIQLTSTYGVPNDAWVLEGGTLSLKTAAMRRVFWMGFLRDFKAFKNQSRLVVLNVDVDALPVRITRDGRLLDPAAPLAQIAHVAKLTSGLFVFKRSFVPFLNGVASIVLVVISFLIAVFASRKSAAQKAAPQIGWSASCAAARRRNTTT